MLRGQEVPGWDVDTLSISNSGGGWFPLYRRDDTDSDPAFWLLGREASEMT